MLNKENYVLWSYRLLRYAKRRPNRKLIYNFIMNGPYVRRMIPEPGDADREVLVNETFHEQTDDELIKNELKQVEDDDQAIQTILLGLPEDIYTVVDRCNTAQEIQNVRNQVVQNAVQNSGVQNVGNHNRLIIVLGIANQNGNGNVVVARAEGNANRNNDLVADCSKGRSRNPTISKRVCLMAAAADLDEIKEVNANCILKANLQQASTSGTQFDKSPIYDSNRSAEYGTRGGTVEQHHATIEETRAYFESLYNNLAIKVEKVNTVNHKLREANDYLTTELASDMSNSDELRHTDNTTLVPPRLPDTLPQVYHRRRPTLGLLVLPSVLPNPPTIRRTARISIPPIEPNLAERARIAAINLDDYQLDPLTPPPSPSSPFTMAVYQRMIAETDPTQREEALTETGQNSVPVPETALTVCTTRLRGQLHTILEDMASVPINLTLEKSQISFAVFASPQLAFANLLFNLPFSLCVLVMASVPSLATLTCFFLLEDRRVSLVNQNTKTPRQTAPSFSLDQFTLDRWNPSASLPSISQPTLMPMLPRS
ncbi:hypothetical protein Tco_0837660 [Tanacetum coccineum]